jgi:hypothetical protein
MYTPDRQVEIKVYSCTINLNGMYTEDAPSNQLTAADLETQKVVRTFVKDANFSPPGANPTALPPIILARQFYAVMTTSIRNGCERCITGIGIAPYNGPHEPSGEFFNAMVTQCPFHVLSAFPTRPHADGAGPKRARGV